MQKTFAFAKAPITAAQSAAPEGYTGLYGWHKYWGKKPHEPLAYAIEQLTQAGDLVVDPFLGSGAVAREAITRSRRFVGFDINPIAIEIAGLLVAPPDVGALQRAFRSIENDVKSRIGATYSLGSGAQATHYLWEADELRQVWIKGGPGKLRRELAPSDRDLALYESFCGYRSRFVRCPRFFSNGRINASAAMTLDSLLTPRAQHNLDLLIEAIGQCPPPVQTPLRLCLTAASGQMTKMVFAVTGRGKTKGESATKVEVGSWVIGYWRPRLHFEVNVWNCFENRVRKLVNALKKDSGTRTGGMVATPGEVAAMETGYHVGTADCRAGLRTLPDRCAALVITDPPHSDRVPYLELSEFWNSILGREAPFDDEIVISNARERGKTAAEYHVAMRSFFEEASRVVADEGHLVLLFNARERESWRAIRESLILPERPALRYNGCFPCNYSAQSVVQDNRKGAMKSDWALVFSRASFACSPGDSHSLADLPGWNTSLPENLDGSA